MKKLDRYLLGQALAPLLFGLLVYSSLAVISVTLPRLQWVVGTPIAKLFAWLVLQLPAALVQTLPIALVLAVILSFGRLATSNELQAVQAGGISLRRSALIFVYLGTFLTAAALLMNERVLPHTNAQVGSLYWDLTSGGGKSGLWRLAAKDIPISGFKLYFKAADNKTDELLDVRIEAWQDKQQTVIFAERAKFVEGGLELFSYQSDTVNFEALNQPFETTEDLLKRFVLSHSVSPDDTKSLLITTSESFDDLITRFSEGGFEDSRSISEVYADTKKTDLTRQEQRQASVLFHRKLAEPFANLTLLLIAVPLSLLYAGNRGVAFGLSLIVTLAWYLLFTIGQLLAQAGSLPVWFGVWSGNIIMAAVGIYLLIFRTRMR
jgi:lipopolysaccharide export system permease protein